MSFDLNTKLMQFGTGEDLSQNYCIKHSLTGVQAFGSNGSGKSSSMKTIALKLLRAGYGFLVLSAKPERETWEEYCRLAGRSKDLVIISAKDKTYQFDFMRYLSQKSGGGEFTSNLLNILKAVIKAAGDNVAASSSDPFWSQSLDLLLNASISLCQLANNGRVSVQAMYDIVQSAPQEANEGTGRNDDTDPNSPFNKAFESIRSQLAGDFQNWRDNWTDDEKIWFDGKEMREAAFLEKFPKAREFKFVEQFFFQTFQTLADKTRSIIMLSLSSFLFQLLQSPIYDLFCAGKVNVTPEDSLKGKIILLDIPSKKYFAAGRSAQLLFKYIWQLAVEDRDVRLNNRPACLWSDESAEFLMEHDAVFNSSCRSSLISVVYIAQNIHQYYAAMGGTKSVDRVKSFLGTLNTKLFFGNSCVSTNSYASELFGDTEIFDPSRTITYAEKFSQTDSVSIKVERHVRADKFIGLSSGGKDANFMVEAYIHVQGDKLFKGKNFKKIKFNQNYR
jgi:hypothetical protein